MHFLQSRPQEDMKNIVECQKDFFAHFNAKETQSVKDFANSASNMFYFNLEFCNLFVTPKKRNHEFMNLKCCKMSLKAFKMKKQGLQSND